MDLLSLCHFIYLILSYLISYHIILSYLIQSYLISYHIILSYLILSYLILSYLILSYLILSYLILSYLILSYTILSYLIISYLISSHSHLISSYHTLSCLTCHLILLISKHTGGGRNGSGFWCTNPARTDKIIRGK